VTKGCNDPDGCGYYRGMDPDPRNFSGGKRRSVTPTSDLRAQADRIRKLSRGR
jgi:hypothetical protein